MRCTTSILLGLFSMLCAPFSAVDGEAADLETCGYHDLPLGMEQVAEGSDAYFENEEAMFSLYNQYMDIYRVADADGSWGHNGENEFGGFPSDDELSYTWWMHWGANTLAMNVSFSWCDCCEIRESDIIFNPAYTWTYDRDEAEQDSSKVYYHSILLHEMGHNWGLQRDVIVEDYAYEHPTVMHKYVWNVVQDKMTIHVPEAIFIRKTYDGQISIPTMRNMVVISKRAHPIDLTWRNATTYPASGLFAGDSMNVQNMTIENTGTETLNDVHVRIFVDRVGGYEYEIGDFSWESFEPETYGVYDFYKLQIPYSAPTGTYKVTAEVTINGYENDDLSADSRTYLYDTLEIGGRTVDITSPALFDEWGVGDVQAITWDSENAGSNVRIRLSRDGGATWQFITTSTPNDGTYAWTVDGPPDTSVWVKVDSIEHDPFVSGTSESFRIIGRSLEITHPYGGEELSKGSLYDIRWNSYDSGDEVSLSYRCGDIPSWLPITRNPITDGGFYTWRVPDTSHARCAVKVTSETYKDVEDLSDDYFSITDATLQVVSPGTGDTWYTNEIGSVDFTTSGACSQVGVELSRDGGGTWSSLGTAQSDESPFRWIVITGPDTAEAQIKVVDVCNPNAFGLGGTFEIATRSLDVTSPNGGEVLVTGETEMITWDSVGVGETDTVWIGFTRDQSTSNIEWIVPDIPNTGSYAWTVPEELAGDTAMIYVWTPAGGFRDLSDAEFSVIAAEIHVTYPDRPTTLVASENVLIQWTSSNAGETVNIAYFKPLSKIPRTIAASTANDGAFTWLVPESLIGEQAVVRVLSNDYPATYDGSDSYFSVIGRNLTVTAPAGGEVLQAGVTDMKVSWVSENAGSEVKISESCDEGESWTVLTRTTENDGLFRTLALAPRRSGCKVLVESVSYPSIFALSAGGYAVGNSAPVAADDVVEIQMNAPTVLSVLGNDQDADGDGLTVVAVSAAAGGAVTHDDVSVTYTPNPGFHGEDSFVYDISDGYGGSDSATVHLTVIDGRIFGDGFESGTTGTWSTALP